MEGQAPLPTSRELYYNEVMSIRRLSLVEERDIVNVARQGDETARDRLLESCLNYVAAVAWRYVCYLTTDDYLDIVGIGNLTLVEYLDRALTMANPPAYLRKTAQCEMFRYSYYRSKLIVRDPRDQDAPEVIFLTEAIAAVVQEEQPSQEVPQFRIDRSMLLQTIGHLPVLEQHVILRHTGLDGKMPESLTAIGKRISRNPKGSLACYYWQQGVKRLQQYLTMPSTTPTDVRKRKCRTTASVLAAVTG